MKYKKNYKILITGINGFIGSNCAKFFTEKGYEIYGIDITPNNSKKFIQGEVNLKNLKAFNQVFDVIIHLAGSGTVGMAQKCPELDYTKTVSSTEHILKYMNLRNPKAKLIYSSSAAVYGDTYIEPIKETEKLNPISIYGKHKVEVEKMCKMYHEKFDLDINIVRFFSIYGEGLKKQLLWDFCNKVTKNINEKAIPSFGTGKEQRDFIHISDAIQLVDLLINSNQQFIIVNGGNEIAVSINEVQTIIANELGYKGTFVFDNITKEGDPKILVADMNQAKELGFEAKVNYTDGFKNYVKWFKNFN